MAEIYGRLRQSPLWKRTPPKAPRLFISHLNPTSGELVWAATRRLLSLSTELFKAEGMKPPILIIDLPAQMEALVEGASEDLPTEEEVFDALNRWSRRCWARLDTEDAVLAEAASLGASLADTFWHMCPPFRKSQPAPGETWDRLLKSQRLNNLIRYVRSVESYLPRGFGRMLRHSLWEWDITGDLVRTPEGELRIAYPLLYALRSWYGIRKLRRRLMKKQGFTPPELTHKERKNLWHQLEKQVAVWDRLLFDRSVGQMLRPSDWRRVRWTSRGLYALSAFALVVGGTLAFFYLVKAGQQVAIWLLPKIEPPAGFQDWLALGGALISMLGFLTAQLRRGAQGFRQLYRSIYEWVLACRMDQRALRAWNGKEKSTLLIALQRLMRAEDA